ncbi:MAG: hypothetical protein H6765_06020 [Candidatus Peribacteria bacterium]|nr:MAG: hypothetical protein H6765_06020 [Candidatus Peribacteria bacterium]
MDLLDITDYTDEQLWTTMNQTYAWYRALPEATKTEVCNHLLVSHGGTSIEPAVLAELQGRVPDMAALRARLTPDTVMMREMLLFFPHENWERINEFYHLYAEIFHTGAGTPAGESWEDLYDYVLVGNDFARPNPRRVVTVNRVSTTPPPAPTPPIPATAPVVSPDNPDLSRLGEPLFANMNQPAVENLLRQVIAELKSKSVVGGRIDTVRNDLLTHIAAHGFENLVDIREQGYYSNLI